MLKKITEHLAKSGLSGWQVRWTQKKSHQSFIALTHLECRRLVETESCIISIFKKKPSGALGMANFKITPANIDAWDKEFEQACFAADLVNNQAFELPEQPTSLPEVALRDPEVGASVLPKLEDLIRQSVSDFDGEKTNRLSYAEFFADVIETRLVNHKGLDLSQDESLLHTEFNLLSKGAERENEFISRYTRRFLKDFDVRSEVGESSWLAFMATRAALPKTGSFPVLLAEEAIDQLYNPVVARASARLKYNKMIQSELGDSVVEKGQVKGDKINLWSDGTLNHMVGSSKFDYYGTPSSRVLLVKDNILKTRIADKRYADYLNVPLTGELGNIEVEAGTTPYKKLMEVGSASRPLYHIIAFSAFEPNAITGNFSAEIRAGYELVPGQEPKPIKGGSVSGVLQRDLLDCRLSKERVQRERILAPEGILFSNLTIAGA